MDAHTRQQYLEAMGIRQWVPRYRLPLAPSPIQAEMPEGGTLIQEPREIENKPVPENKATPARREKKPGNMSRIQAELGMGPVAEPKANEKREAPAPVAAVPDNSFALAMINAGPAVLLLAELPAGASSVSVPVRRFVQELFFALGLGRVIEKAEVFNWPMTLHGDHSETAAREALQASLRNYGSGETPLATIIALGETPTRHLLDGGEALDELRGRVHTVKGIKARLLVTHGITALFDAPLLKKQLWADLLPLLQRDDQGNPG
jgi:hypothetical protein